MSSDDGPVIKKRKQGTAACTSEQGGMRGVVCVRVVCMYMYIVKFR